MRPFGGKLQQYTDCKKKFIKLLEFKKKNKYKHERRLMLSQIFIYKNECDLLENTKDYKNSCIRDTFRRVGQEISLL